MRLFLGCCLLGVSLTCYGAPTAAPADQQAVSADTQTQTETDSQAYLAQIDQSLALAANGQYGTLKRGAGKELQAARDQIASVLASRPTIAELSPDERMALQNADDAITAILQNKDKQRMVCRREAKTGTRFPTTECMTIAQREARANSAAEATGNVQRETCVPGETSTCSR